MERHIIEINSVVEGIFHKEAGEQILMHFHLIYAVPCHVRGKKLQIVYNSKFDKRKAALAK